jgi:hypothetical protein
MAERPQREKLGRPRARWSAPACLLDRCLDGVLGRPANPSIVRSPAGPCCARRTNRPGRWPPGIDGYAELVEPARGAGLTLSLDVEGEPRALPAGIDLAPYRILQEALTNVRKHAPGGRAAVRTRYRLLRQAAALDQEAADLERTGTTERTPPPPIELRSSLSAVPPRAPLPLSAVMRAVSNAASIAPAPSS